MQRVLGVIRRLDDPMQKIMEFFVNGGLYFVDILFHRHRRLPHISPYGSHLAVHGFIKFSTCIFIQRVGSSNHRYFDLGL